MKAFLISDNVDTFVGMRTVGIKGIVVHSRKEVLEVLEQVKSEKDIGIIIMTEKIGALVPEEVRVMKMSKYVPLVIEIPDRHGSNKEKDSILKYVKESIGLKI